MTEPSISFRKAFAVSIKIFIKDQGALMDLTAAIYSGDAAGQTTITLKRFATRLGPILIQLAGTSTRGSPQLPEEAVTS